MYVVYILQSIKYPDRHYTGITTDLESRLVMHNHGDVPHSSKHSPWKVIVAVHFESKKKALAFEKYLKSGSGRAFSKRHF